MVRLYLSNVYILNVHNDRMSQPNIIVLSMGEKESAMCNITTFGTLLTVAWDREVSFVDYQFETGQS